MNMEATGEVPTSLHPESLHEKPPEIIANVHETIVRLLTENGWYLIFITLVCALLWPKLRTLVDRWQQEKEQRLEDQKRRDNPELYQTRQLAMEVARLRMQSEHDARAQLAAEKAAEKEDRERQERVSKYAQDAGGHRLNSTTSSKKQDSEPLGRTQYNPLMGAGASGGFRPTRRSCPGGGCG